MRRSYRLLALGVPLAALAAAAHAAASHTAPTVQPFVSVAPHHPAAVEAATTATPAATALPTTTPAPTAAATPVPTVVPVPPPTFAPAATAPPAPPHNRLISADGKLNTGVGIYSDCSGATPLTHTEAAIDTCVSGRTYFVGHNPGVFTPLLSEGVGSIITWYDGAAHVHRLRIVSVRSWQSANGVAPVVSGAVVAQFQTCENLSGSVDWIYDAVAA